MKDERRIHPRIPVNPEFVPVVQSDGFFVQDLSTNGLFLRTADDLPVDSVLRLRFSVLVDDVFVFDLKARVARQSSSHPKGLGVEFVDVEPSTKARLEQVLRLSGLRHRWEEGAEVSRQDWDEAQKALRPGEKAAASAVEFAADAAANTQDSPAQSASDAQTRSQGADGADSDEDEVTRVFYYEGDDDPPKKQPST